MLSLRNRRSATSKWFCIYNAGQCTALSSTTLLNSTGDCELDLDADRADRANYTKAGGWNPSGAVRRVQYSWQMMNIAYRYTRRRDEKNCPYSSKVHDLEPI